MPSSRRVTGAFFPNAQNFVVTGGRFKTPAEPLGTANPLSGARVVAIILRFPDDPDGISEFAS
ncbi:hypothetical protein B0H17DRAFT_1116126 [Mycena rosella]|uniref:Uncharacterized protein n=1 Tax=Mycena rosella TaxID=1033263 RepID=A0AAD7FE05_MYCRO|nr:hypothetical protein B0H17DRAFT_1116126 [Mycena rosella]